MSLLEGILLQVAAGQPPSIPEISLHKVVNGYLVITASPEGREHYIASRLSQATDLILELMSSYEKALLHAKPPNS